MLEKSSVFLVYLATLINTQIVLKYSPTFIPFKHTSISFWKRILEPNEQIELKNGDSFSIENHDFIFKTLKEEILLSDSEEERENQDYNIVETEFGLYLAEPEKKEDPLKWWNQNKLRFSILSNLAKKYLAVPGN